MTRKTYSQAQHPETAEMRPLAQMANSPRDIHPTRLKRQHSARTLLNDEPSCKERITEEKMAARLRGFHITPRSEQSENWFFMRPQETFEEIEQRLADWEDDDMDDEAKQSSEGTTVTLSPELNELIAQKNRAFGPAIRQPKNDMQVVVWTPQPDFVQDIANKALGPQITELEDDGEELEHQDAPQQPQIVTFPDVEDADSADISVRRRRKSPNCPDLQRCSSSFLIREMIDEDGDSGKEMECDD